MWRQTKSATCDDSDDSCFSLDLRGAVTTSHDKRGIHRLNDDTTTSVQSETAPRLHTHVDVSEQSLGGRPPPFRSPSPKQVGNTRATCRGIADNAMAHPSAHKHMIGKYMIDVSDLASWQKRQITWVCVATCWTQSLDQGKNVTQLLVLTRIRQDVATRKCVAGMISPPRQHTSCSSKVISASTSIAHLLHRVRIPWILEHPCDSWLWDDAKILTLAAQPRRAWALVDLGIFGSPCRMRTLFLVGNVDNRDSHRMARKCVGTSGSCRVSRQKDVHPNASARRSSFCSSHHHTPARLSFALAMVLNMQERRF